MEGKMKRTIIFFLLVAAAGVLLIGCNLGGGVGGANANLVVYGNMTVPDSSYWDHVKIGIFSGGTAGLYPGLATFDNSGGVGSYRVVYSNSYDSSPVPIPTVGGSSYSINGSGATQRSYSFTLPTTVPPTNVHYYFAAWYDGNSNDILDLVDSYSVPEAGEFNRSATKAIVNANTQVPTDITVNFFSLSSFDAGKYKYSGWDNAAYNDMNTIDATNNSGFNFDITANSGW